MAAALPPECRHRLPSGHSPFLSMPGLLARELARIRQAIIARQVCVTPASLIHNPALPPGEILDGNAGV